MEVRDGSPLDSIDLIVRDSTFFLPRNITRDEKMCSRTSTALEISPYSRKSHVMLLIRYFPTGITHVMEFIALAVEIRR